MGVYKDIAKHQHRVDISVILSGPAPSLLKVVTKLATDAIIYAQKANITCRTGRLSKQ